MAKGLITSVASLTKRSQGLQWFRDGVFALCQSRMNGFIDNAEFTKQLYKLRDISKELMLKEMENPNWNAAPTVTIAAPAPSG